MVSAVSRGRVVTAPGSIRVAALAVIVWIVLLGLALAQPLTFPALTGRVVDEAGVLNVADRAALSNSLAALETRTGNQLVVVTLKSLRGTTIEDYGYQLGRRWGIGEKGKNTGVLLIVAPNDRVVRLEVGYGLEGMLTDAMTKTLIETVILPQFKAGDLPGGIRAGVDQIVSVLSGDARTAPLRSMSWESKAAPEDGSIDPVIIAGLIAIGVLIFCAISGGAFCQSLLQILFMLLISGRGGGGGGQTSADGDPFRGGGGSFGGGGSSGRW